MPWSLTIPTTTQFRDQMVNLVSHFLTWFTPWCMKLDHHQWMMVIILNIRMFHWNRRFGRWWWWWWWWWWWYTCEYIMELLYRCNDRLLYHNIRTRRTMILSIDWILTFHAVDRYTIVIVICRLQRRRLRRSGSWRRWLIPFRIIGSSIGNGR